MDPTSVPQTNIHIDPAPSQIVHQQTTVQQQYIPAQQPQYMPAQPAALSQPQYVVAPGLASQRPSISQAGIADDLVVKYNLLRSQLPAVSIFLQPLAAPSALGFAAFFCACWTQSTWYADWYGSGVTPMVIAPFVLMMGIAEFVAGMFCYPARDTTGTVFHCTWGGWWMAWSVYFILAGQGHLTPSHKYEQNMELAMLLVTIAAIDGCVFLVTLIKDVLITSGAALMFIGSVLQFGGWFSHSSGNSGPHAIKAGAYFWAAGSIILFIRAVVYMLPFEHHEQYGDAMTAKHVRGQPRVAVPIGEPGIRTFH